MTYNLPNEIDVDNKENAVMLTGLSFALMSEISGHLDDFAKTGIAHTIDLRALPMTDDDLRDLDARLGKGEVIATLAVSGNSEIWETEYAGVWRIRHFGGGEKVMVDEIIITRIPEILMAHPDDISVAAARLRTAQEEMSDDIRDDEVREDQDVN